MRGRGWFGCLMLFLSLAIVLAGTLPVAAGSLAGVESEIRKLREENERNQRRIQELESTVNELKSHQAAAPVAAAKPEFKTEELRPESVRRAIDRYLGEHRLLIAGYGFAQYDWHDKANANTFTAGFNPIFLFRLNDRLLFSSELEVKLPDDAETEVNLEFAQADYVLNDYVTVAAGKYLLPFGEFIEHIHPPWINKLVSPPLPFREGDEGGILPFTNIGVQLRGGVPLGYGDGASAEYTVYTGNGPRYESQSESGEAAIGDPLGSNNIDFNRNKAFGARVGVRPLPYDLKLGRWRVGASTYDGLWDDHSSLWFTSWGLDSVYRYGDAELRGEYVSTKRNLAGSVNDHRDGWYVQGSYQLASIAPAPLDRLEMAARYSRQDQRQAPEGSVPHAGQVSVGLDYWLTPSVAWKLEYDRDLLRDTSDDNVILTQFAVGF